MWGGQIFELTGGKKKKETRETEKKKTNKREGVEKGLSLSLSPSHARIIIPPSPFYLSLYFFLRSMSATSSRLALPRECVPSFFFENRSARFSRPVLSSSPMRRS